MDPTITSGSSTELRAKCLRLIKDLRKYAAPSTRQYFHYRSPEKFVNDVFTLLRPETMTLLSQHSASISDLQEIDWIKTKNPGVYFCIAWFVNGSGDTQSYLYVGCAWSYKGGLEARKQDHMQYLKEEKGFLHEVKRKADGAQLSYHWGVLCIGEPFKRTSQSDLFKPCKFYLVESMLALWLGAHVCSAYFLKGHEIEFKVPWHGLNQKLSIAEGPPRPRWARNHIGIPFTNVGIGSGSDTDSSEEFPTIEMEDAWSMGRKARFRSKKKIIIPPTIKGQTIQARLEKEGRRVLEREQARKMAEERRKEWPEDVLAEGDEMKSRRRRCKGHVKFSIDYSHKRFRLNRLVLKKKHRHRDPNPIHLNGHGDGDESTVSSKAAHRQRRQLN